MNIVISGVSSGLGLELTKIFLSNNHKVIGFSRAKETIIQNVNFIYFPVDIADKKKVIETINTISFSDIDLIINNAGLPGKSREIEKLDQNDMQMLFDVNVFGPINLIQTFLPLLKKGEAKRIINISSRYGSLSYNQEKENKTLKKSYSYRISKAAQNMLAVCLSNELSEYKINVEVIHPGSFISKCGRKDANDIPGNVAKKIYDWIINGKKNDTPKLFEINGKTYNW
jgi:NAD(P)-dependent dehydrogenase (short-subunit alcohol dehydrogenase family)